MGLGSRDDDGETPDLLKVDSSCGFSVVARKFYAYVTNESGDAGGFVPSTDGGVTTWHAAIAHADGVVEVLPGLPGDRSSAVLLLSDGRTAYLVSFGAPVWKTHTCGSAASSFPVALPDETPADPGVPYVAQQVRGVNDRGELVVTHALNGVTYASSNSAFRFDAVTQTLTELAPPLCDPHLVGFAINQRGDVLGYSGDFLGYSYNPTSFEHIGVWNEANEFSPLLTQTTASDRLAWNDGGLVVVSSTTLGHDFQSSAHTYVVPAPGVALDLASLVDEGEVPLGLQAWGVNARGDFLAESSRTGKDYVFLRRD